MTAPFDVAIVGGGIVGLATAFQLSRAYPGSKLVLIEKEPAVGAHQTGHNSGVIHSGLYYKPGSAKARLCTTGQDLMKDFCRATGVPFQICGKLVVAVHDAELPALEELHRRGLANGVPNLALVGPEKLREVEPHAAGIKALHLPGVGIIDYKVVAQKLGELLIARGVQVRTGTRVAKIAHDDAGLVLHTTKEPISARFMIGCAGLHSDRLARREGSHPAGKIVPFRGEYYELIPERRDLVRGLIYPVADPRFPFLGVHFTRMVNGGVEAGPNAVLALKREGYRKMQLNVRDAAEVLTYPGFWKMAAKYWRTGFHEVWRSYSKKAFVRALSKLVPEITAADVQRAGAGVRAQALLPTGAMVDDFLIEERPRALHVLNAPSPAATASLAIGAEIVRRAAARFELGVAANPAQWLQG